MGRYKPKTICIDFDGTCVTHEFPRIGRYIGAEPVLRRLLERGDKLILWTMRSEEGLARAVAWFAGRGIPLFGINSNPGQQSWTTSPKAYAHIYIDDAAAGCPLCRGRKGERPYVNWRKMERILFPHDRRKKGGKR